MKWPVEKKIAGGLGLLLTIVIIIGVISFKSALKFTETSRLETKSRMILKKLEIVLTEITDAETGQRGYIITGDERYLVPYHAAAANIDREVEELSKLIRDNPDHQRKLDALKPLLAEKLEGLNERIDLRKNKGFEAAAKEVASGKGRIAMDKIRKIITEMEDGERELLKQKAAEAEASSNRTIFIILFGSSLAFVIVGIASFITRKELILRKKAEESLKKSYDELEQSVEKRTAELHKINESLQREITERKQAEEKYKNLAESLSELIYRADPKTFEATYVNSAIEKFYGYTAEAWLKDPKMWERTIHPDDKERVFAEFTEAQMKMENSVIIYRIIRKDGTVRWLEDHASWEKDQQGNVISLNGVMYNITERKRAEEKLENAAKEWRVTFDSTNDLIMLLDSEMKIIKVNLATAKFLNRPFNEILGKNCFQLLCGADGPPAACPIEKMKMTKKHEEVELYLSERGIWIWISVDPIFDDKGNLTGSVYIIKDITERKKAEEELHKYQEQLRSLASQLSLVEEHERHRIATDLHDHIGQTLALCQIKLGALRESASPTLAVSVDGIRDLIDQTIQYTRSLTSELSPPILYELGFEAAIEWLGEQILTRHGIQFYFENDGQNKPMEDEARVLLFQTVRELLVNVAKHSQARNSSVYIRRDGNNIQIKVEDDGVGFDASKLESYLKENSGFGLFSIRERLNRIRGYLNIESEPGKGSRVTVVAPLKI